MPSNNKGLTIIEVLIASALAGVLALYVADMSMISKKQIKIETEKIITLQARVLAERYLRSDLKNSIHSFNKIKNGFFKLTDENIWYDSNSQNVSSKILAIEAKRGKSSEDIYFLADRDQTSRSYNKIAITTNSCINPDDGGQPYKECRFKKDDETDEEANVPLFLTQQNYQYPVLLYTSKTFPDVEAGWTNTLREKSLLGEIERKKCRNEAGPPTGGSCFKVSRTDVKDENGSELLRTNDPEDSSLVIDEVSDFLESIYYVPGDETTINVIPISIIKYQIVFDENQKGIDRYVLKRDVGVLSNGKVVFGSGTGGRVIMTGIGKVIFKRRLPYSPIVDFEILKLVDLQNGNYRIFKTDTIIKE